MHVYQIVFLQKLKLCINGDEQDGDKLAECVLAF